MSDFLEQMRLGSVARCAQAKSLRPQAELEQRVRDMPSAPALHLGKEGFDVIAEIKRRSPAEGPLATDNENVHATIAQRAVTYARGGACAISVLTEPERFDGDLSHVSVASAAVESLGVPVMRKDFLVDPYEVFEARAAGAGGVLLITRMLSDAQLGEMLDVAYGLGLFVLVEAFDAEDLKRSQAVATARNATPLIGVNTRDLTTLEIDRSRLETLAPNYFDNVIAVAESGLAHPDDAGRVAGYGYRLGLVGTALMKSETPYELLQAMLWSGRTSGIHVAPGHA
ncbi:MAG: indole-3-glycerol-phosphate synthase [Gammaproteobacteria bacterium]